SQVFIPIVLEAFVKKNALVAAALVLAAIPAAAQQPSAALPGVAPGAQTAPLRAAGPRGGLSLRGAVARARDKDSGHTVAGITPRLSDFSLAALNAAYRPNVTSQVFNRSNTTPVTNQTQGATGDSLHTGTVSWQGGFAQNMKWHGGSWTASWTNSRVDSSNL